jgi:hypothetical protein
MNSGLKSCLCLVFILFSLPAASRAQLVVDCTGATPGAFPSINAALPSAGVGTAIFVIAGPCNENVLLAGQLDLFIGTYYGSPNVTLNGGISVADSHGVYFHGLDITNPYGEGMNVSQSGALILDTCTSNGNGSNGLDLGSASEVFNHRAGIVRREQRKRNYCGRKFVCPNQFLERLAGRYQQQSWFRSVVFASQLHDIWPHDDRTGTKHQPLAPDFSALKGRANE